VRQELSIFEKNTTKMGTISLGAIQKQWFLSYKLRPPYICFLHRVMHLGYAIFLFKIKFFIEA